MESSVVVPVDPFQDGQLGSVQPLPGQQYHTNDRPGDSRYDERDRNDYLKGSTHGHIMTITDTEFDQPHCHQRQHRHSDGHHRGRNVLVESRPLHPSARHV